MKKIYSGRCTGKTTELIKIATREHVPIVVVSHSMKGFVIRRIDDMVKTREIPYAPDVIVYDEISSYKNSLVSPKYFKCVVDDSEYVLGALLNSEIIALSLNKDE